MSADMQTTAQMAQGNNRAGDAAIVVDNFTKSYGSLRVVDQLSLSVQCGEVFALLGPNGAGKTTTIETLEGDRKPDQGSGRLLGFGPIHQPQSLQTQICAMLQQEGLYPPPTTR